jgi:hypothetical protein
MTINVENLLRVLDGATPGPWISEAGDGPETTDHSKSDLGVWSETAFYETLEECDDESEAMDLAWVCGIWGDIGDQEIANSRLIAMAPDLAREYLVLREAAVELAEAVATLQVSIEDVVDDNVWEDIPTAEWVSVTKLILALRTILEADR